MRELARTERVLSVWKTPPSMKIYMGQNPDGSPRRLREGVLPIRAQLKDFAERVILRREPRLEFKFKIKPADVIQIVRTPSQGRD